MLPYVKDTVIWFKKLPYGTRCYQMVQDGAVWYKILYAHTLFHAARSIRVVITLKEISAAPCTQRRFIWVEEHPRCCYRHWEHNSCLRFSNIWVSDCTRAPKHILLTCIWNIMETPNFHYFSLWVYSCSLAHLNMHLICYWNSKMCLVPELFNRLGITLWLNNT